MSAEDFDALSFIQFKTSGQHKEVLDNVDIEGKCCLDCGEKCPGYAVHPWKKYCKLCQCAQERHNIPNNNNEENSAEKRMCVEEVFANMNPISQDDGGRSDYDWVPRGLNNSQIEEYMLKLPQDKVPKVNSSGAAYRTRQLIYQMPLQDFSSKHCRKLPPDQELAMDDVSNKRVEKALGVGCVKTGLTCPASCTLCNLPMDVGEMAVFAERAGPECCWHPACFVCAEDKELLADLVYCFKDSQLFCPRHYNEKSKPRCAGCEELIYVGEYTQAIDKNWHPGHLCCCFCDESLSQKKFVTVDGHPACIPCYEKDIANTCEACHEPIGPGTKDVDARNKHWHEHCFACTECQQALLSKGFTFKEEKLICHDCRGITPAKQCEACSGEFEPGEKKVGYQNKTFHERCFVCDECAQPIGSKQFVRKDDKRLCGTCFDTKYAKTCFKCNEIITTSSVKHDGNTFHSTCFTCAHCSEPLAGKPFTKQAGETVCQACYRQKYAKRCDSCESLIEGSVKFVTYNDKFYHRDCFTCAKCSKPLAGEKFRLRGAQKVCIACDDEKSAA